MNRRERRGQQRQKFARIETGEKANFHRCTNYVSANNLMQTYGGIQKGSDGEWRLVNNQEVVEKCPYCPTRFKPKSTTEFIVSLNEAFVKGDKD